MLLSRMMMTFVLLFALLLTIPIFAEAQIDLRTETLVVKLYHEPIDPNIKTKITVNFINPQTQKVQEHIDYTISVSKDGETVFGPIPLTHTSTGSVTIPIEFNRDDGVYSLDVDVTGILFQPISTETFSFDIVVGKTFNSTEKSNSSQSKEFEITSESPIFPRFLPLPELSPEEKAEEIVKSYYSYSFGYLALNNTDSQRLSDVFDAYVPKVAEKIPKEAFINSVYLASDELDMLDRILDSAGLREEFYADYVGVWKDIANNKLELLDSFETKKKKEIDELEIGNTLKESYISRITQITKIQKNDFASQVAKTIEPFEEKSNSNVIQNKIQDEILDQSKGGGCLIATATYGSELAPQVQQLRELRDNQLLQTESGTNFMESFNHVYYSFSPTMADWERENPVFKEAVKITLVPLLTSLSVLNNVNMDSESTVLGYGISLILLNVGMYFVAPFVVIRTIRKKL
ncbi:CFI-box-CTERM domain-containing protein [Nitrosopumilus sp.]|uniref:CFI-box-CTERM domain-containing protein n=1 Tax=Nitrosopumilus sp. TaxID=2024843 RepID=UPI0034A063CD